MSLPNQVPTAPETRSATLVSQDEAQDEGLWMSKSGHKKDPSGNVLLTSPHHGYGIPSNEPAPVAPLGVAPSHKISTTENFKEAPAQLASSIHELDIGSGQIYKPHTNANPDLGDLIPRQSSRPYANASTSPLGLWDISKDVPASSGLNRWTKEDLLKWGIGEGIDINDRLPPITNYVSVEEVEGTAATNKLQSDTGHVSSATVEVPGSLPPPLSAVSAPTVAESHTLPLAETEDTAATGNTDIDSPCSYKVPSASERPESLFALRDVSVIP